MLTRFSLLASFSVSYFIMLGIIKNNVFLNFLFDSLFGKCWLIPALDAGRPRRRFCPPFCHSFWLLSNLIRNYRWSLNLNIFQMSNPIIFIFSLFTNHFTHSLYINKCYKINLLKKYFVVMIRDRKQYIKFHLIGNKYETKRLLNNAMFMFSRWWKSMYEMTFPCKMS